MGSFGITFGRIRNSKGLTQEQAYGNILRGGSRTAFENGDSDIFAMKLYGLLKNVGMTFEEFEYIHHHHELPVDKRIWNKAISLYNNNDINALRRLLIEEESKHKSSLCNELDFLTLKNMGATIGASGHLSKAEMKMIVAYLDTVYNWTTYELVLFSNNLNSFDIKTVKKFIDTIDRRTNFYNATPRHNDLVTQMYLNVASVLIEHKDLESAVSIRNKLEVLIKNDDIPKKIAFHCILGAIDCLRGRRDIGEPKMLETIASLRVFGCHEIADSYQASYDKLLKMLED